MKIAIVGATGLVGKMVAKVLTEQGIHAEYTLFNTLGGAEVEINGKTYITQALNEDEATAGTFDYVFFCAEKELSQKYSPFFAEMGSIVIDNSSAFRRDPYTPLIVPECNAQELKNNPQIIANPNCTTIGAVVALKPLDDMFKLKRVVFSSYQAISGAGANPKFIHPIENNLITHIDGEEEKMVFETQKILGRKDIKISATCIRVPVKNCHTISVNATFKKRVNIDAVKAALASAPGVILLPDDELPMPIIADGRDDVFVGRVRIDESCPKTINMITVLDNVRKGAATNAVQILKCLMS